MQFSVVALLVAFAASAYAVPTGIQHSRRGCDIAKCALALGPTAVSCVSAAVQAGVDPISDASCLAGATNSIVNTPASCDGCASGLESDVAGAIDSAENVISSIF